VFIGVKSEFLSVIILLPVVILMWMLSRQLNQRRKRKSYTLLSYIMHGELMCYGFIFLVTLIASMMDKNPQILESAVYGLHDTAFILLLYGFFRIFNNDSLPIRTAFFAPAALIFIVSLFVPIVGTLLSIISVGALAFFFARKIGRNLKPTYASGVFILYQILILWVQIGNPGPSVVYFFAALLPTTIYTIMFMLLQEHILNIMQSSYGSSITDPLTGLFNRRYFTQYIGKCVEKNVPVNVVFSDIDNFKKLNDTKGHKVGDDVLKQVSSIFMDEIEGIGVAGRYGGEEMVLLVQETSVDMAILTERIRSRIEKETIATASIGYRIFEHGVAPDMLIKHADEAMYAAKTTGKNRVVRYQPGGMNAAPVPQHVVPQEVGR
jgi:diguanylate cyclase (GGDEF)-like protein